MNGIDRGASANLAGAGVNYNDLSSLSEIKKAGRDRDPESLRKVAQQFESMFVQMMLKTMRQTNEVFGKDNPLNSSETKFYQQMLDSQMSLSLSSGKGMGLADAFYNQLNNQYQFDREDGPKNGPEGKNLLPEFSLDDANARIASTVYGGIGGASEDAVAGQLDWDKIAGQSANVGVDLDALRVKMAQAAEARQAFMEAAGRSQGPQIPDSSAGMVDSIEDFINQLAPAAKRIANYLGVDPKAIVAQAALETGWGQHVIHDQHGQSSNNLFNIKSSGEQSSVSVNTVEYRQGEAQIERASFRSYGSVQESFNDYARLLKTSPRYQDALAEGRDSNAFVEKLQAAGYATDPNYADKIKQILQRREFDQIQ